MNLLTILYADHAVDGGLERLLSEPPEDTVSLAPYRWLERGRVYERDGQAVAYLAQPYTLSTEDLAEILEVCERYRLRVDISMRSEWEPGQTLGILLWREKLNPFIPPHLLKR